MLDLFGSENFCNKIKLRKAMGIPTIEINPARTVLSGIVDYQLAMGAAEALDQIWNRYEEAT